MLGIDKAGGSVAGIDGTEGSVAGIDGTGDIGARDIDLADSGLGIDEAAGRLAGDLAGSVPGGGKERTGAAEIWGARGS